MALRAKPPAANGDLRGGKGSLHEGGVRVPTIVTWPGKLKPAVVTVRLCLLLPTSVQQVRDGARAGVESVLGGRVADLGEQRPRHGGDVERGARGDFAPDHHEAHGGVGLAGDARRRQRTPG